MRISRASLQVLAGYAETSARLDAMGAELATLKAEREADKKAAEVTARRDAAVAALRKDGYHVSDYTVGKIAKFAAAGDNEVAEFVEHYRKVVRKDGPDVLGDNETPHEDAVLSKFSALGAEVNDVALEAADQGGLLAPPRAGGRLEH